LELAFDIRVGPLEGVRDSKEIRKRICKHSKRDLISSGKKY